MTRPLRVLVAEDDDVSRQLVGAMLVAAGHSPVLAATGEEAWEVYLDGGVDLLITDWMMPGMDGPELCRRIREKPLGDYTYIVVLTSLGEPEHALAAMQAGADDHLSKPLHPLALESRLVAASRITSLHGELAAYRSRLWELHLESATAARTDPLTGLGNRLRLTEDLDQRSAQVGRYGYRYWVGIFDLDRFKAYNDIYGHLAGDEVLRAVADALVSTSRRGDAFYRYGGEEFIGILPELTPVSAVMVGERLRRAVENLALPHVGNLPAGVVTASVGVAPLGAEGDLHSVLAEADRLLYQAKANGRNRVAASTAATAVLSH